MGIIRQGAFVYGRPSIRISNLKKYTMGLDQDIPEDFEINLLIENGSWNDFIDTLLRWKKDKKGIIAKISISCNKGSEKEDQKNDMER